MKLHNVLQNKDCIGQKVTADIPVGLDWVDYPDNYPGGVITPDGVEPHEPNNDYRDVYAEGGLLAFCQGETCEIRAFNENESTVTLLNNDPNRSLSTGDHNATEFTIPYEWYTACFGTAWPFEEFALNQAQQMRGLNLEMARRAHEANSFREFNGERIQEGYNAEVSEVIEIGERQKQRIAKLYPGIDLTEEYAKIDRLVASFSKRLEDHYNKGFSIEASCPSIMISGGSNFPARKKERQNTARQQHNDEYKKIRSVISNIEAVGMSIKGNNENAVDKLKTKIDKLKEEQTRAKEMNAFYRKNGTVKGFDGIAEDEAKKIDTEVKNSHSWAQQPVPSYQLTSINNKIKEAEKRLQALQPQTDLEIRLELEVSYYDKPDRVPLTLENLTEQQSKLDESNGSAYISGKVFAGDRHTSIGEWVYSKNSSETRDWSCTDIKKAISRGVSGGTVNKKIIADCWDKFLHGSIRSERQAERLDGAKTIGEGEIRLEEGRINIYFNGKPDADVISKLKSKAFKWSPNRTAWTRQDTPNARYAVKALLTADIAVDKSKASDVTIEKPSVLAAIRADRGKAHQPQVKTAKEKKRTDIEH